MAIFARSAFAFLGFYQVNLTVWLVPIYVAGGIAAERERRTLGDVLTTRLTSAEIVLGKLTAGLVKFASCLAIGFPAIVVLPLMGGVDLDLLLLACASIASTAFFVGGLSILISNGCLRAVKPSERPSP